MKDIKRKDLEGKPLRPESLMMSYGYEPGWSEGAIKSPIFQTSTFVFRSAEEGKAFFELAYGLREKGPSEQLGLIYSRLNNPDLEILEDRLTLWDDAEDAAVFTSGMSAIATLIFEFLEPGDWLLHSEPLYGGTEHMFKHILPRFGIRTASFVAGSSTTTTTNLSKFGLPRSAGNADARRNTQRWLGRYSTNSNGPLPTGVRLKAADRISACSDPRRTCAGRIARSVSTSGNTG